MMPEPEIFNTMDKKITKLSDLKGLYIRVQQSAFMMDLVSMLGAQSRRNAL